MDTNGASDEPPVAIADPDELPRADGGIITGSAAVAGLSLLYNVGKDFLPRLKAPSPIILKIIDSSSDAAGGAEAEFRLFNASMHTLYIEALAMIRPEVADIWVAPVARPGWDSHSRETARLAGSGLPWRIEAGGSVHFFLSIDAARLPADIDKHRYGAFTIEYSELDKDRPAVSPQIRFRLRTGR